MSAIASSPDPAHDQATRRLVTGLVLSLLAHAVLLSLRFHVPEAGLAAVTTLMVRLAPTAVEVPPPAPEPVSAPNADLPPATALPPPKVSGFIVVPPRLQPVAKPPAPQPVRAKATRHAAKRAKRPELALNERVITQDINKDSEFTVPQPLLDDLKADAMSMREGTEQGTGTAAGKEDASAMLGSDEKASQSVEHVPPPVLARQDDLKEEKARQDAIAAAQAAEQQRAAEAMARQQAEEQARLAQRRDEAQRAQRLADDEARRQAEQQQLVARQQVEAQRREAETAARIRQEELARQEAAQQRERALAEQERIDDEARRQAEIAAQLERQRLAEAQARQQAEEAARLAQRQAAEQARQQAERLAQQQAAEQARQQADRLAQQQAAEQARQQADRLAQQQAERLAQQQAAEQARQQAERLAQQHAAEQARQQAERLAQQAAEQARQHAQRLAEEQARADRDRAAIETGRSAALAGNGAGAAASGQGATAGADGAGKGAGGLSGVNLGSRARDMLRGLEVLGAPPPAARPVESEPSSRRLVSHGAERDVPLRLYVDSFRQKIERNGLLNGAQLSASRVRVDPIVSVAIRSDGSVESVIIVRSSGHADIDAAVRRIVRLNERYGVFPPNVAVQFDVIEIRRIWTFAEGLKLMEEVR